YVGLAHPPGDPGPVLPAPGYGGAQADDLGERGVGADHPAGAPQRAAEAGGRAEGLRAEHRPRVGGPPQDRLSLREPGEDAVAVGVEQPWRGQVAAEGEQPVRMGQGPFRSGEGRVRVVREAWQVQAHARIVGAARVPTGPRSGAMTERGAPGEDFRVAAQEAGLLVAPRRQRLPETRVGDPVPAADEGGEEAARDLVLAL